ncbi:MAG: helix-turn-helix transcriptional regulator [Bacillota bacterium]|nr:helix-turn-helix transcriptional regulator [Bacillota bacterium]
MKRITSINRAIIYENIKLMKFIMKNVIEEMVGKRNSGRMVEIDKMMVCLVNFSGTDIDDMKKEMNEIAKEAQKFFKEHYCINLTVSTSDVHKTVRQIPKAYDEPLRTMEYKRLFDAQEILSYEDIKEDHKYNYYYPLDVEQQLINTIKVGDFKNSEVMLNEIFQNNFSEPDFSLVISRCLIFDLMSTIMKIIADVDYDDKEKIIDEIIKIEKRLGSESISEMKRNILNIVYKFCQHVNERKRMKNKCRSMNIEEQLKDKVIQYVLDNYKDYNLAITSIARQLNLHPISLSRTFLEQTGQTLVDFINRTRIKHAKELFKENYNNLDQVAKAVGYSSVRTFTRSFKKHEGVTPGKYKEAM